MPGFTQNPRGLAPLGTNRNSALGLISAIAADSTQTPRTDAALANGKTIGPETLPEARGRIQQTMGSGPLPAQYGSAVELIDAMLARESELGMRRASDPGRKPGGPLPAQFGSEQEWHDYMNGLDLPALLGIQPPMKPPVKGPGY